MLVGKKVTSILSQQAVLIIAFFLAIISCFFVPFNSSILSHIDLKTLVSLMAMMLVIAGFKHIKLFRLLASVILKKFETTRKVVFCLVAITFVSSMFIANDMALLTFLPFTLIIFQSEKDIKLVMFTMIMQNIAANLGGMLTPFGNPQNIYLYSHFDIGLGKFLITMLPAFLLSALMIFAGIWLVKDRKIEYELVDYEKPKAWRIAVYCVLFVLSILIVFKFIPFYIGGAIVAVAIAVLCPKAYVAIDYGLLLTFVCFFIFSGNMAEIPAVNEFLSKIVGSNTYLFSLLSCQIMSNVPTAILFAQFVPLSSVHELLLAVNIGGSGTLIASLASLITFKQFNANYKGNTLKYLAMFTVINVIFLVMLSLISLPFIL